MKVISQDDDSILIEETPIPTCITLKDRIMIDGEKWEIVGFDFKEDRCYVRRIDN